MDINRRNVLKGVAAGVVGTAVTGGLLAAGAKADADAAAPAASTGPTSIPFHGEHQAGITTPQQRYSTHAAFDVTASSKADLLALFGIP